MLTCYNVKIFTFTLVENKKDTNKHKSQQ